MDRARTGMQYLGNIKAMNETIARAVARGNLESLVSFPLEITITALQKCNYRCRMCYQPGYEGELDWAVVEKLVPILPFARAVQIFGGEPLLYRRFTELCRLARENDCYISTISNGSLLTDDTCRELVDNQLYCIKFSIDAGTAATYRRIRGGDFAKVMGGIERLSRLKEARRTLFPAIDFNFLAMRSNLPELPRLLRIAASFGVREVNVFYPSILKEELVEECVFFDQERSDEQLLAAREIASRLGLVLNLPPLFRESPEPGYFEVIADKPPCEDPWTKLIVGVDGEASLCCAGPTVIGNLGEAGFDELWNGPKAAGFRRLVNTPKAPAFCRVCGIRQGSPREAGYHLKTPELLKRFAPGLG